MPENTTRVILDKEVYRHYPPAALPKEGGSPIEMMVSVLLGVAKYSNGRGTRGYWAAAKPTKTGEKTIWRSACLRMGGARRACRVRE